MVKSCWGGKLSCMGAKSLGICVQQERARQEEEDLRKTWINTVSSFTYSIQLVIHYYSQNIDWLLFLVVKWKKADLGLCSSLNVYFTMSLNSPELSFLYSKMTRLDLMVSLVLSISDQCFNFLEKKPQEWTTYLNIQEIKSFLLVPLLQLSLGQSGPFTYFYKLQNQLISIKNKACLF